MLDTYQLNLAGLLLACGVLFATRPSDKPTTKAKGSKTRNTTAQPASQRAFFAVYALVMASDWLQGPFLYALYRDEHRLPPHLIPHLFTTGFLAGALSAPFVGALADAHGRRAACLAFCLASAASCLLTAHPGMASGRGAAPSLPLLFAGRALGGLATSLLFSVFETWMVADFQRRRLGDRGADLSRTFGLMSTVNSVVAIVSGLASEWLVALVGTPKAPFGASVVVVAVAAAIMLGGWDENYGAAEQTPPSKSTPEKDDAAVSLWGTLTTPRMLALALASTAFEGSMYLFVVLWAPVLESAAASSSSSPEPLPYGLIFASFMSATLLASLAYSRLTPLLSPPALLALLLAAASLLLHTLAAGATTTASRPFWLFCAFEAVVGAYFPAQATLKNALVPDAVRGRVYAALRVPLNAFVVLSLLLLGEGSATAASTVFFCCAVLLQVGAAAVWFVGRRG